MASFQTGVCPLMHFARVESLHEGFDFLPGVIGNFGNTGFPESLLIYLTFILDCLSDIAPVFENHSKFGGLSSIVIPVETRLDSLRAVEALAMHLE